MKIIQLKSSNIKRLKAVELVLDEKKNLVLITGKNAQGKTSILDSIWYALGGKKAAQGKPIREGAEKGEIELDVDGYFVKRTFTDKGSYLQVNNKEGAKYSNPQEFLDFIMGNLSFDPLEFSRMDAKKQIAELTKVVGLDFSKDEEKKKGLIQDRLLIGREIKSLGAPTEEQLAEAKKHEGKTLVSITELSKQLEAANAERTAYANAQNFASRLALDIENMKAQIVQLEEKIRINVDQIKAQNKIADTKVNIELLKTDIANAEATNNEIRNAMSVFDSHTKAQEKKKAYDNLTAEISLIDEAKKTKLSTAKMPIEGLSWNEDQVLYNNIPYEQISAAEQLRVSMAIAMASDPKLKVILIRDGSLLDSENMKVIEEMSRDKDFQVWIEKVQEDNKIGIYIEDGSVKSIDGIPV